MQPSVPLRMMYANSLHFRYSSSSNYKKKIRFRDKLRANATSGIINILPEHNMYFFLITVISLKSKLLTAMTSCRQQCFWTRSQHKERSLNIRLIRFSKIENVSYSLQRLKYKKMSVWFIVQHKKTRNLSWESSISLM